MSHSPAKLKQSADTHPLSAGVLILEAAIATLVVSVFATSSPALFTARLTPPRETATQPMPSPQNQILSLQSSFPGQAAVAPTAILPTAHP